MNKWVLIYLIVGIISRVICFIYDDYVTKKYGLEKYEPFSFPVELIAHAMDVAGWPFATIASFYLLHKEIKNETKECK